MRWVAIAVAAVLVLAGCRVDARVDVTLRADGTGTVTARVRLDAEAVRRLTSGAPLAGAVRLDDLREAGWDVSAWKRDAERTATITLSRDFTGRAELARRLRDLAGPDGALRDPVVARTRGWFGGKDALAISVSLRRVSAGVKSDARLLQSLREAGVDVDSLDARLKVQLRDALHLTVAVHLPGGQSDIVELTPGRTATVAASSSETYTRRIALFAIGGTLLLAALVLTTALLFSRSRANR